MLFVSYVPFNNTDAGSLDDWEADLDVDLTDADLKQAKEEVQKLLSSGGVKEVNIQTIERLLSANTGGVQDIERWSKFFIFVYLF